jgi:hypothetical protein
MEEVRLEGPLIKLKGSKIYPCHCCGNRDLVTSTKDGQYKIKCIPCNLEMSQDRADKVVVMWNKRTTYEPKDTD